MPDDLPEDPRHWPTDPFALLGVRRGAGDGDVKRAYVRLIKRFKPEHFPEQFRRVRDAYETCRVQSAWYRRDDDEEPAVTEPSPAPDAAEADPVPFRDDVSTPRPPPARPRDSVADAWELLTDGPDPAAFAELLAAAEADPERAELFLRLYWLLAFHPTLDAVRDRHHWLARALHQSRFGGSALELYRRELETNPALALDGPYRSLLDGIHDAAALAAVALPRIAAAGRSGLMELLADDLAALRRLRFDDEPGWLAILVAANDWAAWVPNNRALDRVVDELAELRHLELQHSWAFDRIDHVRAASAAVRVATLPPPVLALVRAVVATHGGPTPGEVEAAAAAVAADAANVWHTFDSASHDLGPGIITRAFETYRRRSSDEEEVEYPPLLIRAAAARLWTHSAHGYARWRPHLLRFLQDERLDPLEFAAAFQHDKSGVARGLASQVATDTGLRAVWLAFRVVEG